MNTEINIRWLIARDLPSILEIEKSSFEYPWGKNEFLSFLRQRNGIGMVAEIGDRLAGYMLYQLHPTRIHLFSIAVDRKHQRKSVGTTLVRNLMRKVSPEKRKKIDPDVRETNLAAQLFFRSIGFKATSVVRDFYHDSEESAYLFTFSADIQTSLPLHQTRFRS